MSNKIKFNKKKNQYNKVKRPAKITFKQYLADMAGCGNIRIIFPSILLNTYYNTSEGLSFESIYDIKYNPDPRSYEGISFVVFQRSATPQQLEVIKHFKKYCPSKPLIYELDDDLFNIPEWNFASAFYNNNRQSIIDILKASSGITVSTLALKKSLLKYNKNIKINPNHLPKFLWGDTSFTSTNDKPRICYPGSFNHFDQNSDKGDFSPKLIKFISDTVDEYQWVFVGGIPKSLENNPKIERHGWVSVIEYPQFMKSLNIDIMLAILEQNKFNECKSNIKALEATALGVPLLCSNIEPYIGLAGVCDTTDKLIHQIEVLSKDIDKRKIIYDQQYRVLEKQLYWEDNDNLLKYVDSFVNLGGGKL